MTTLMDMDKQSHSIFALDSHEFNDIFSISGGARYEYSLYDTNRNYTSNMIIPGRPNIKTELFRPMIQVITSPLKSLQILNTQTQESFISNTKEVLSLQVQHNLSIRIKLQKYYSAI